MRFLLCLIFLLPSFAQGSQTVEPSRSYSFVDEWASPLVEGHGQGIMAVGSILTLALVGIKEHSGDSAQRSAGSHQPLGDFSLYGDILGQLVPNILYAGSMYTNYKLNDESKSLERATLMAKATFYSGLTTTVMKYTLRQQRPRGREYNSFPSGHTATAFAFASVIGMEHDLVWSVPAYLMAAFVGFSRMNDNRHYTHDVIGGATLGTAYGVALGWQMRERKKKEEGSMVFLPTLDSLGAQVGFQKAF